MPIPKGTKFTREHKAKIAAALRGQKWSEDRKKKHSKLLKGKYHPPLSEETKRKIGFSHLGKEVSQETRQKLSKLHKGKVISIEVRQKMSLAHTGKEFSQKTKNKISQSHIKRLTNKQPDYRRKLKYNDTFFHNSWEVIVAKWLDKKKIKWEYEKHSFIRPNGKRYIPDFYLPEKKIYLEVKGYFYKGSAEKMNDFVNMGNTLFIVTKIDSENFLENKWEVL